MLINQAPTACDAFHAHSDNGLASGQRNTILRFIETAGGSWSIGELAEALKMQKSTVSARLNEMLHDFGMLVELGWFLQEMTMETNHYKTTAYAIRIGDEWFAGFGGKPGQESLTKVRPGLCDAKLVWDERKAAAYVERLRVRGYMGEIVKVTA